MLLWMKISITNFLKKVWKDFSYICIVMKRLLIILSLLAVAVPVKSQEKQLWDMEVTFAARDTSSLSMDIYFPKDTCRRHPCIVYIYGGGFVDKNQREESVVTYCREMADEGFVTIATDYRLGLKGVKSKGLISMADNLEKAIKMSTEDLFSAVQYLLAYSEELTVDPEKIILVGSSAGAITALQADYELSNRTSLSSAMPEGFRFAGVVSFSGAVFSRNGKCEWSAQPPAPTMFFHGTADELVTYDKIRFMNIGFFGTNSLVKSFEKNGYPYMCVRFGNRYHEVAAFMRICAEQTKWFIEKFVFQKKNWRIDTLITDPDMDIAEPWTFTSKDLYGV